MWHTTPNTPVANRVKSHKKHHNFRDTPDDTCHCSANAETSQHFLLHCSNFIEQRKDLFEILNAITLAHNLPFIDDKNLVQLLLYGHKKFNLHENQSILKATINFIRKTSRFSQI